LQKSSLMKYMNKEKFGNSYLKISEETSDAVKKVASELNLLVEENSDEFIITENKDDNERKIHFTKIGDKVPVGGAMYPYEDFFKAAMMFPGDAEKQREMLNQLSIERDKRKFNQKKK